MAIVAFDRPLPGNEVDAVLVENRAGTEEAVEHLLAHGHKRIACMGYDEAVYTVNERIQGYRHCMNSAGLKPCVVLSLETIESVRMWVSEAMSAKHRPTAIFSLNHRTSTFLLQALAEQNVRVPEEMALIGFDDFDLASVVRPPLTVVTQSPVELARRSMDLLMESIRAHKEKNPIFSCEDTAVCAPSCARILWEASRPLAIGTSDEIECGKLRGDSGFLADSWKRSRIVRQV